MYELRVISHYPDGKDTLSFYFKTNEFKQMFSLIEIMQSKSNERLDYEITCVE